MTTIFISFLYKRERDESRTIEMRCKRSSFVTKDLPGINFLYTKLDCFVKSASRNKKIDLSYYAVKFLRFSTRLIVIIVVI